MSAEWVERAKPWVGEEPSSWVASLAGRSDLPALRSDDLTDSMLRDLARAALAARSERSSVFTQANVYADVERQLHGVLFAPGERAKVSERAVGVALSMAKKLSPPEFTHVPERFRVPDGTSQFAPATSWQYTTVELLEAEARLLEAGRDTSGPAVGYGTVARVCSRPLPGGAYKMGQDQAVAVEQVATSGRVCDVLVGPAGTGKTVALSGLLAAWEEEHGLGSVKGLAPSASAAANLSEDLGIPTENTAKWLSEVDREAERLGEISRLRVLASQLPATASQSVDQRAAELEAEAGRWQLGTEDLVIVEAWKADTEAGKSSLMVAHDNETVRELNRLARADRVAAGQVAAGGLALADGSVAGPGDVVVARRNDRHLRLSDGEWVRNRDRFAVTGTHEDGSMTVRALDRGGEGVLPATYVSQHVELGYASSVWSAQGRTVGTAHAIVGVGMTRESLYVAATRGRESNRLYVDVEPEPSNADMAHGPTERLAAREVLVAVASRRGADVSAHETMSAEWARAASFEQLVKEHQSLAAAAMAQCFDAEVTEEVIVLKAARAQQEAIRMADEGRFDEAKTMLELGAEELRRLAPHSEQAAELLEQADGLNRERIHLVASSPCPSRLG